MGKMYFLFNVNLTISVFSLAPFPRCDDFPPFLSLSQTIRAAKEREREKCGTCCAAAVPCQSQQSSLP